MNRSKLFCALSAFLLLCTISCLKSAHAYVQPQPLNKYTASIEINKPKDQVWKKLVSSLGKEFFVINNLDKESGLINISYSGDPQKYVDCGTLTYDVENARGPRHYEFPGSQATAQYETTLNGVELAHMRRQVSLDGRINIIVESISETRTKVNVNVKYILTKTINGEVLRTTSGFNTIWVPLQPHIETNSFNTNQRGIFPQGQTNCQPTGALESEILALLND